MLKGILNFQIEKTIKKINAEDLNNNFDGVFPAYKMNKFIDFKQMIYKKTAKYPFLIGNTQGSSKERKHWLNTLNIEPKKRTFFL